MRFRVIYTPDEREYSFPEMKIIEGESPAKALADLAEIHDIEVDEEAVENGEVLDLIDQLYEDDSFNLTFFQNEETGYTYFDRAFS